MKKSKWLALAGVAVLSVGILAACSSKSSTSGTTYGYVYSSDPETLDYITSNTGPTTTAVTNGVDGLMETDKYGNLVPSVAEDWSVSQDGLTYTYKIRKGVKWYTSDGEEYADVTAKDFVTGLKHAADSKAGALYLVQDSIAGLSDYLSGADKDFSRLVLRQLMTIPCNIHLNDQSHTGTLRQLMVCFSQSMQTSLRLKEKISVSQQTQPLSYTMVHSFSNL